MSLNTTPRTFVTGEIETAAIFNTEVRDAITGIQAAGTAYTPTASAGLTVGNGTWSARYGRTGKWVTVHVLFTFGTTSSVASAVAISLPVAQRVAGEVTLAGHVLDSSAGAPGRLPAVAVGNGAGTVGIYTTGGSLTATVPFTWATGDLIQFEGTYEAA